MAQGPAAPRSLVLIGGDGAIARQLAREARAQGISVFASTRRASEPGAGRFFLDLSAPASELPLPPEDGPVIIAAAQTGLNACENDPRSAIVNVEAPARLAAQALAAGRRVVFISTDTVFDGSRPFCAADDPTAPVTAYGRQKAEAERRLRLLPGWESRGAVVRLTKVISGDTPPFPGWQASLARGEEIAPFSDLAFAPISMRFAAAGLLRIAISSCVGTLHLSGATDITYADFARLWVAAQGLDAGLVKATTSREAGGRLLHNPRHCALDMARTQASTGITPQNIDSVVTELSQARAARAVAEQGEAGAENAR